MMENDICFLFFIILYLLLASRVVCRKEKYFCKSVSND